MMLCGEEVPLQVNEYFGLLRGEPQDSIPNDPFYQNLNRYSFMWLGAREETDSRLFAIIKTISLSLARSAYWISIWDNLEEGYGHIRSKHIMTKRKKEGWNVYKNGTLGIASKMIDFATVNTLKPSGYTPVDGKLLFFTGFLPTLALEVLASDSLRPSLNMIKSSGRLLPDKPFLSWIIEAKGTLIYSRRDELNRLGLVMLTTHLLDVKELKAKGLIDKIEKDDKAGSVWFHSWRV